MSDSREAAVKILQNTLENKAFFQAEKDDAFINMLVLTSLRHLVFIKKSLKQFAKKKIPAKHNIAEYAMILAATEILYLDSPDYAVLNSYVDIVKKYTDKYVAGFINAVLRNIVKNKEAIKTEDKGEFFPPEFLKILNLDYNKKTIHKIEQISIKEPPLDITVKDNADKWAEELDAKKLDDFTIRIFDKVKIPNLNGFIEGEFWVQDYAASLAVKTLKDIKGKTALDLCAAPGGKTAQLINMGAKTTAVDISETRLETLKENLSRLNLKAENIIAADAIEFLKTTKEQYDIILLDAPCSATGTIRRHPELVHIKTLKDVEKQALLQKEFLSHIDKVLKPEGILVYCVCSISQLEGEKQIDNFLLNNPNYKLCGHPTRTLPHNLEEIGGMDSFYIAKLQKA